MPQTNGVDWHRYVVKTPLVHTVHMDAAAEQSRNIGKCMLSCTEAICCYFALLLSAREWCEPCYRSSSCSSSSRVISKTRWQLEYFRASAQVDRSMVEQLGKEGGEGLEGIYCITNVAHSQNHIILADAAASVHCLTVPQCCNLVWHFPEHFV